MTWCIAGAGRRLHPRLRETIPSVAAALVCGVLLGAAGPSQEAVTAPERSVLRRPLVEWNPIPYGPERRRQMAAYSARHYGHRRWRLRRKRVIVLHFTGGSSYESAWNAFAANSPARGELPGVCTHYIVARGGVVHQLVRLGVRCRHAIGLNHRSLGIEMVQPLGRGPHWAAQRILHRRPQMRATLRLVRYLRARFGIPMRQVIGHAMANSSPYFRDLQGWRNDHSDWLRRDVKAFRRRLARIS
jgi:N-acetylmuramoyl-L-alanine amidase-like protein